jgi:predicted nucleotidyltransferase
VSGGIVCGQSSSAVSERADQALLDTLAALAAALRSVDAPSMVIGGIAVIALGVPRQTIDVDATVWAESVDLETLLAVLARHTLIPRIDDVLDFARQHQILLLRHEGSGTPVDLSLAWLPFEREALDRALIVDFGGVELRVARPEDLIVYKAVAWRDRDRGDIERLLVRYRGRVDLRRVGALVREFALALDEPRRIEEFEALVARTLGPEGVR